jgi:hypothetical protein
MGKKHLGVLRGLCHGQGVGQVEPEPLYVLEGLAAAVRPVYETEVVKVNITVHVGIGNVLRKTERSANSFFILSASVFPW